MEDRTTAPLYDRETRASAVVLRSDLTAEDIKEFCISNRIDFHGMGCPKDCGGTGWDDASVFRGASYSYHTLGLTIKLDTVVEWKAAKESIGVPVESGGVYRHVDGNQYVTVCEATDAGTGLRQIVYRSEDGKMFTRSWNDFFSVILVEDRCVSHFSARFVFIGFQSDQKIQ